MTGSANKKLSNGYTLIEVIVAVTIFFTVFAAPTGFFILSLQSQQKALASQELFSETSYALEYISRALRMAKKDKLGTCVEIDPVSGNFRNYQTASAGKLIRFLNYENKCQEFWFDETNKKLQEKRSEDVSPGGVWIDLTSTDLEVISFKIGSEDSWEEGDNEQPRVTFFLEVKGKKVAKPELQPEIKIQTTISQRNLDVDY